MPASGSDRIERRRFIKVAGAGAVAGSVVGCLGDDNDDPGDDDPGDGIDDGDDADGTDDPDEGDLLIGGVQPYSGPFAEVATEFEAGFEMALAEVNADGGVLGGRELTFRGVDSETDASEGATIATEFIEQDDVIALTGPVSTDVGLQVAAVAEDLEVPVVFNQVGSHEVTTTESRFTFRMGLLPAPTTAMSIVEFVEERDFDTVSAIIADYGYGHAFQEALEAEVPDHIELDLQVAPFMESDFAPYLRDVPDDVDVIVATSHPPGAVSIFQTVQELDVDPEFVLGVSEEKPIWTALGESATDGWVNVTQPYPFSEAYEATAEEYVADTDEHFGVLAALGYTAGSMIAAAVEDAGEADPAAIADAIRNTNHDSLFAEPVQYTEWGELDQVRQVFTTFAEGGPDWNPDNEWHLEEEFVTEPQDGFDPDAWGS